MSYQISFKGRGDDDLVVSTERGEKLKVLVFDGKKDTPVDIDGDMYLIGSIKSIVQVPDPAPKIYEPTRLIDDRKPRCRGTNSIQLEINNIIKADGRDWAKRINDKIYREQIRRQLVAQQPDVVWCDYKADTCACKLAQPAMIQ